MHDVAPWSDADAVTPPAVPHQDSRPRVIRTLLAVLIGLAPILSLGWTYWLAEVAISLSLLVALTLAGAGLWRLVNRRVASATLMGLLAAANAALVVSHIGWPSPAASETGPCAHPLRTVSINVLNTNRSPLILDDYLRTRGFDIVFLQEVSKSGRWSAFLDGLLKTYPFQARPNGTDVAILSKLPFRPTDPDGVLARGLRTPFLARSTAHAVTRIGGREIVLLSAHLSSPQTQGLYKQRNRQLDLLAAVLARDTRPLILGADLNGVPWTPPVARFRRDSGLRTLDYAGAPVATRPNWLPYLGIQIDYILPSASAFQGVQRGGTDIGSDHLPLEAHLCLIDGPSGAR